MGVSLVAAGEFVIDQVNGSPVVRPELSPREPEWRTQKAYLSGSKQWPYWPSSCTCSMNRILTVDVVADVGCRARRIAEWQKWARTVTISL